MHRTISQITTEEAREIMRILHPPLFLSDSDRAFKIVSYKDLGFSGKGCQIFIAQGKNDYYGDIDEEMDEVNLMNDFDGGNTEGIVPIGNQTNYMLVNFLNSQGICFKWQSFLTDAV